MVWSSHAPSVLSRLALCASLALVACSGCGGDEPEDRFVGNDSAGSAVLLAERGMVEGLVLTAGSEDYYLVDVVAGRRLRVDADFDRASCSVDLDLLHGRGSRLARATPTDGGATLVWAAGSDERLQLRVTWSDGAGEGGRCAYDLGLTDCVVDAHEPNDDPASASRIELPYSAFSLSLCDPEEQDWLLIPGLESGELLTARAAFRRADGDLDMSLFSPSGARVAEGANDSEIERLLHRVEEPGAYRLQVRLQPDARGPGQSYDLDVSLLASATGCRVDPFEPNDDPLVARPIVGRVYEDLWICGDDVDWFRFPSEAGVPVGLSIDFTQNEGDLDLTLFDSAGRELAAARSDTDDERIVVTPARSGPLFARVELARDLGGMPGNLYGLALEGLRSGCVDDVYEPNDGPTTATLRENGTYRDQTICPGDDDWYRLELRHSEELILDLGYDADEGNIDLLLLDETGTEVVAEGRSTADDEHLVLSVARTGTYLLQVTLTEDRGVSPGNAYDLGVVSIMQSACSPDDFEPNDTAEAARQLADGSYSGLSICEGEPDHYLLPMGTARPSQIRILGDRAEGELHAALLDRTGARVAEAEVTSDGLMLRHRPSTGEGRVLEVVLGSDAGDLDLALYDPLGERVAGGSNGAGLERLFAVTGMQGDHELVATPVGPGSAPTRYKVEVERCTSTSPTTRAGPWSSCSTRTAPC